jgi:hypothetical protein
LQQWDGQVQEIRPGEVVTSPPDISDGGISFRSGSTRTEPVNHSGEPLAEGPLGQTLIVTAEAGRLQQWDGQVQEIRPGEVVRIPASAVTIRVWPSGCVCQAVRAPGSKVTSPPDISESTGTAPRPQPA